MDKTKEMGPFQILQKGISILWHITIAILLKSDIWSPG